MIESARNSMLRSTVKAGLTFTHKMNFVYEDGNPINFPNATIRGSVVAYAGGPPIVSFTVDSSDLLVGEATLSLSSADTQTLGKGFFYYDAVITDNDTGNEYATETFGLTVEERIT